VARFEGARLQEGVAGYFAVERGRMAGSGK